MFPEALAHAWLSVRAEAQDDKSRRHEPRELDGRIDKLVWLTVPPPITLEALRRRTLQ